MGVYPSGCTPFFIFHTSHTNHKNTQRQTQTQTKIKINPLGRRKEKEKREKEKRKKENIMKAFKNLINGYIFLNVQGNVFEIYDNENFVNLVSISVEDIEKDPTFEEFEWK